MSKTKTHSVKMAAASKEDVQRMYLAFHLLETVFHYHGNSKEDFEHFDKDHEKKSVESIFNNYNELDYEYLGREVYNLMSCGSFGRVVMGFQVLYDNAADPELDYLDWKPELKKFIESNSD